MNAHRESSVDRPHFVGLREILSPASRKDKRCPATGNKTPELLDVAGRASDNIAQPEGDTTCDLLAEAAFDVLGAARFIRSGNLGFARQSIQSALNELTIAAVRLDEVAR